MAPEIPPFLSHLKTYRGFPVPITAMVIDGVPDFRVVDSSRIVECLGEELCAICGIPLGTFCCFIGGELCKENHLFADPAMHEPCAEYAAKACPFVSGNKTEYSSETVDESKIQVIPDASAVRPAHMYLLRTRTKDIRIVKVNKSVLIQAGPWWKVTEIPDASK
jgi:hypothetical protein